MQDAVKGLKLSKVLFCNRNDESCITYDDCLH